MDTLFNKYNSIGLEKYKEKLEKLDGLNIVVYGCKSVGKKTLIECVYPNALYLSQTVDVSKVNDLNMSLNPCKVVVFTDRLFRSNTNKLICSMIDKMTNVRFIFSARNIQHFGYEIISRSCAFHMKQPDTLTKRQLLQKIASIESISYSPRDTETIIQESNTVHDLIINMELMRHNIHPQENTPWKHCANELCDNLTKLSSANIRQYTYKLYANAVHMSELICYAADRIHKQATSNVYISMLYDSAAYYQHATVLGNKHIYHVEAFLSSAKNILIHMNDDLPRIFADKASISPQTNKTIEQH